MLLSERAVLWSARAAARLRVALPGRLPFPGGPCLFARTVMSVVTISLNGHHLLRAQRTRPGNRKAFSPIKPLFVSSHPVDSADTKGNTAGQPPPLLLRPGKRARWKQPSFPPTSRSPKQFARPIRSSLGQRVFPRGPRLRHRKW